MKKNRTAQLRGAIASTRRISVSAPARRSRLLRRRICEGWLGEGGFFNLRTRICLALCSVSMFAYADIITVINTNDSGPGSLRQALADANDGDTINFDPSLNDQTITLTTAELQIAKNVTVSGPGPNLLTVARSSQTSFRILHVMPGHTVTIGGLKITGGASGFFPCGGVWNDHATLTLNNCSITGNFSGVFGGGICNNGQNGSATLTIVNSTVIENYSGGHGGGIYDDGSTTLAITNSTVSNNFAISQTPPQIGRGGGIYKGLGMLTITDSTIDGNVAVEWGGGLVNGGPATITNSTISRNGAGGPGFNPATPGLGGGIFTQGPLTISNSTISDNTAWGNKFKGPGYGGGINSGFFPQRRRFFTTVLSAATGLPTAAALPTTARWRWKTRSSTEARRVQTSTMRTEQLLPTDITSVAMTAAVT